MYSEHQPRKLGKCKKCGGEVWVCEDWDRVKIKDHDPQCPHELDLDEAEHVVGG